MAADDPSNEMPGRRMEAELPPMPPEVRECFEILFRTFTRAVAADPGLVDRLRSEKLIVNDAPVPLPEQARDCIELLLDGITDAVKVLAEAQKQLDRAVSGLRSWIEEGPAMRRVGERAVEESEEP